MNSETQKAKSFISKTLRGIEGFTLVEMLVSMMIVAITIVAVISLLSHNAILTEKTDKVYTTSLIAKARISQLDNMPFDQMLTDGTEGDVDADPITGVRVDTEGDYDPSGDYIRATEVTATGNIYLVKVKVCVDTVQDGAASGNEVTMETMFNKEMGE